MESAVACSRATTGPPCQGDGTAAVVAEAAAVGGVFDAGANLLGSPETDAAVVGVGLEVEEDVVEFLFASLAVVLADGDSAQGGAASLGSLWGLVNTTGGCMKGEPWRRKGDTLS